MGSMQKLLTKQNIIIAVVEVVVITAVVLLIIYWETLFPVMLAWHTLATPFALCFQEERPTVPEISRL